MLGESAVDVWRHFPDAETPSEFVAKFKEIKDAQRYCDIMDGLSWQFWVYNFTPPNVEDDRVVEAEP